LIIEPFELEFSARKIAARVKLGHPTVLEVVRVIRVFIVVGAIAAPIRSGAMTVSGSMDVAISKSIIRSS
jgi:hypothetical protein